LHENLQTLISKRSEQDIVCVVLCPFPDMSLDKTAGSGAVDIVYICEYSQVSNSTAQARAVWWDLEKYKLVPQGRDQVAKLPLFVRTQTHRLGKSQ